MPPFQFSITISWWIIPLMITAALFAWVFSHEFKNRHGYGYDIEGLFRFMAAIVGSLVAWLVWAIFR
ncbi:hypothetical protein [Mesorhizobium sp. Cs1299R1N3]|uniref:hypothetical protein n=1 Tax=Mesorhizobium sp. Cs1299R1N3 TaxID=3015173 RepID=UPI00301BDEE1